MNIKTNLKRIWSIVAVVTLGLLVYSWFADESPVTFEDDSRARRGDVCSRAAVQFVRFGGGVFRVVCVGNESAVGRRRESDYALSGGSRCDAVVLDCAYLVSDRNVVSKTRFIGESNIKLFLPAKDTKRTKKKSVLFYFSFNSCLSRANALKTLR